MNTKTPLQKKVIFISGGTMVHIRPHLSLCAPAYANISNLFYNEFQEKNIKKLLPFEYIQTFTKMADSKSHIETNEDMVGYVKELIRDPSVKCIIMAAAICDFDVSSIETYTTSSLDIGKQFDRLKSNEEVSLNLVQSDKIVSLIKKHRPDILLISFKTTSGDSLDYLTNKCIESMEVNDSDFVFGNDIKNKVNILIDSSDKLTEDDSLRNFIRIELDTRSNLVKSLVNKITERMSNV